MPQCTCTSASRIDEAFSFWRVHVLPALRSGLSVIMGSSRVSLNDHQHVQVSVAAKFILDYQSIDDLKMRQRWKPRAIIIHSELNICITFPHLRVIIFPPLPPSLDLSHHLRATVQANELHHLVYWVRGGSQCCNDGWPQSVQFHVPAGGWRGGGRLLFSRRMMTWSGEKRCCARRGRRKRLP